MALIKTACGYDVVENVWQLTGAGNRTNEYGICRSYGAAQYHYQDTGFQEIRPTGYGSGYNNGFSANLVEGFVRWYLYIEAMPDPASGDGEVGILLWHNTVSSNASCGVTIDSNGTLKLYNGGSINTVLATASRQLTTGVWYRMESSFKVNTITSQPAPNPPYQSNARFVLKVNGATVIDLDRGGGDVSSNDGIDGYSRYIGRFEIGYRGDGSTGGPNYATCTAGFICDIDDVAFGEEGFIGPGYTLDLLPTNIGTYSGWGIDGTNYEKICHATRLGNLNQLTSTTSQDLLTMEVPTLREAGFQSESRYVHVWAEVSGNLTNCEMVLIVNGTEYYEAIGATATTYWCGATFNVTIQPDDTLEIGLRKDATATVRGFTRLAMTVEALTFTLPTPNNVSRCVVGSYVGNGTQQEINVGFRPDFIIVYATSGAAYGAVFSNDRNGYPDTPYSPGTGTSSSWSRSLTRFTDNGFKVCTPSAASMNTAGTTYSVVAIADPAHRACARTYWRLYSPITEERVYFYNNPRFATEFVFAQLSQDTSTVLHAKWAGGGLANGRSTCSDTVNEGIDTTDQFTDIATAGRVSYGANFYVSTGASYINVFALDSTKFFANEWFKVFNYTGNGAATQVVSLPAEWSAKTLEAAIVMPIRGVPNGTHHYFRGPGFSASDAHRFLASGIDSSRLSFAAGSITVGGSSNLNVNAAEYVVIGFVTDTDTLPRTVVPPDPDPGPDPPGTDPPDDDPPDDPRVWEDWPDGVPGLLGVRFGTRRYIEPNYPKDKRTYKVKCEQREFPVGTHEVEFDVRCEQREFDALEEYP